MIRELSAPRAQACGGAREAVCRLPPWTLLVAGMASCRHAYRVRTYQLLTCLPSFIMLCCPR
eukprot:993473-Pleurochrysis_carterae.AAC.1